MTNKNLGRKVVNRFKVPKKQWNKWTNHACRVFNQVYHGMRPRMQTMLIHPGATVQSTEHWNTVRWNAAWLAAAAANGDPAYTKIVEVKP